MDESNHHTTSNTVRVWSYNKQKIAKNATRINANVFAFYSLNGSSLSPRIARKRMCACS
ncbi:hypothetical protein [Methanocella conradii]|uniref:hypothetical protein n=1 Tax=Methanocella conradii TaxID=1175444 RepID=UPI00157C3824